jgi:hypothetical protein
MKSLMWKDWRENVKWIALPALLILRVGNVRHNPRHSSLAETRPE